MKDLTLLLGAFLLGIMFGVLSLTVPGEWTTIWGQRFRIIEVQ
jgi:hypothetical protein